MSERGDALRLAICLDTAGLVPECRQCRTWDDVVAALSLQFFALPSEVRRAAKAEAGRIMSDGGLVALGRAILPDHPLFNPHVDRSCLPSRPKCDLCRKATWDSREAALEFCPTLDLEPFRCPAHEGKWHITSKQNPTPILRGTNKG
jgi:hypothetical protein